MKIETKNILSIKEYAAKKGISVQAVYQAIRRGTINTVTIGGKHFIEWTEKN